MAPCLLLQCYHIFRYSMLHIDKQNILFSNWKIVKSQKLSHDDHKTRAQSKNFTRSQKTCVVTWTEPPIPILLKKKVMKEPTARVVCWISSYISEFENSSLLFLYCQSPFYKNVLYLPFKQLITISITYHPKSQYKTTPHVHYNHLCTSN